MLYILLPSFNLCYVNWYSLYSIRFQILLIWKYFMPALPDVLHWTLRDIKSPPISSTRLGIPGDLSNVVVWIVSNSPLLFKSSNPCTNLVTLPSALFTMSITVTFLFYKYLQFYYYHYYSLHIFTGVWVTARLLKSPGLFTVFWPFSITRSIGWTPLVRQLPSSPVPLVIL